MRTAILSGTLTVVAAAIVVTPIIAINYPVPEDGDLVTLTHIVASELQMQRERIPFTGTAYCRFDLFNDAICCLKKKTLYTVS